LNDESGVSLRGIRDAKESEVAYIELYTNSMPELSLKRLEDLIGKRPQMLSRDDLEERSSERILKEASRMKLRCWSRETPDSHNSHHFEDSSRKNGDKDKGRSRSLNNFRRHRSLGLQNYKFGRSVTIPFPGIDEPSETPYEVLRENRSRGLHTLVFLDVRVEEGRSMRIHEGLGCFHP